MKIQLKRSNVLENGVAKEPTAAQMEYGELAVNYNENDISIFTKDSDNNIRRVGGSVNKGSGEPGDPGTTPGDWYFDITNNILYYWDGSGWEEVQAVSKLIGGDGIEITTATTGTTFAVDLAGGDDGLEFDAGKLKATIASFSEYGVVKIGNGLDGGSDGIIKARNTITVGEEPPVTNLNQGDLWWNSGEDSGRLYVYYEDENTQQWIDASPQGGNLEQDQADQLYLSKKNDDTAVGNITFTKKIFVDEAVGIGTSSPSEKLTVIADQQRQGLSVLRSSGGAQGVILSSHTTGNEITNSYPDGNQKPLRIVNYNKDLNTQSTVATFSNTGRVGIGVDSPNVTLQVSGPSSTLAIDDTTTQIPMLRFRDNGTTIGRIYMTNEDMRFDTGGTTERIRITKAGRVGINSTAPSAILEINGFGGSTNNGVPSLYLNRAPSVKSTSDIAISGNAAIRAENSIRSVVNDSGFFSWSVGGADVTAGTDGSSEIMRISPTGNVGIGTDSPQSLFHLKSDDAEVLQIMENSVGTVKLYSNNKNFIVDADQHRFRSETGSERVRIDSNGNVGIGVKTPRDVLHIAGNNSGMSIGTSNEPDNRYHFYRDSTTGTLLINGVQETYSRFDFRVTPTDNPIKSALFINNNGNVGIGTTAPGSQLEVSGNVNKTFPEPINLKLTNIDDEPDAGIGTGISFRGKWADDPNAKADFAIISGIKENSTVGNYAGALIFGTRASGTGAQSMERMRIDSGGRLLIGQSSGSLFDNSNTDDINASLQVCGSSEGASSAALVYYSGGASGQRVPSIAIGRSRGSTAGTYTVVSNGDKLGEISFHGASGTQLLPAARITAFCVGTPGATSMPGVLSVATTKDGSDIPVQRLRINPDGRFGIGTNGDATVSVDLRMAMTNKDSSSSSATRYSFLNQCNIFNDINVARFNWTRARWSDGNPGDADWTCNEVTLYHTNIDALPTNITLGTAYGYVASSGTGRGNTAYGFYSDINTAAGKGRWNFYANGDASNYFSGNTFFGSNSPNSIVNGGANGAYVSSAGVRNSGRDSTSTSTHQNFYNPNGNVGSIKTSGSSTIFEETSDYRLKENISPLTGATDQLKALKPCVYNFKADPSTTIQGFIAHEAQEVCPQAVTGTKDATEAIGVLFDWDDTVIERGVTEPEELTYTEEVTTPAVEAQEATYDEDGNELTPAVEAADEVTETVVRTMRWEKFGDRAVMQGIDKSKLVPLLTAALQEAFERIEQLESKVSAL